MYLIAPLIKAAINNPMTPGYVLKTVTTKCDRSCKSTFLCNFNFLKHNHLLYFSFIQYEGISVSKQENTVHNFHGLSLYIMYHNS